MIRSGFIIGWIVLTTAFFAILAIVVSFFTRTGNPVHIVARVWSQSILMGSRVHVGVRGLANIKPDKSYVYMANHQSNFDIPVLLGYLPVQFRWLAKAELFKIPVFGRAMLGAGYVEIDRFNRKSAFESIEKAAQRMKDGVSVMIFPEGTRSKDGSVQPFKKGGFVMAIKSGVPIIPVILRGTWPIMAKSSLRINPGDVEMEIGEPIDTSGYSMETKEELMDRVRAVIRQKFENPE
ncbi:MAG: lysophospholipid acyltransferase family protein [Deltaproteobacteria bacterium]|nr:lysophospholipid acyltransferase family protein [Deltaproteobacteria bacterium]